MEDKQKILLIEPPYYRLFKSTYSLSRYPLSLGYLAGSVKENSLWDVMVYNADFNPNSEDIEIMYMIGEGYKNYIKNLNDLSIQIWNEIKSVIENYKPLAVGISSKSANYKSTCNVAKIIKEVNRDIIVIVGGPHPSMVGKDILADPNIDIAVKGEGEVTIIELLNAIESNESLNSVNGIAFKDNSQIIETPPREYIKDLGSLCFPYQYAPYILKDYDQYPKSAFSNVFATRGCLNNCFFCGSRNIWDRQIRLRPPMHVVEELKHIQRLGINHILFVDDIFGGTKENIRQLCNSIAQNCPGLKWSCEMHVNTVDEKIIDLMKRAGCYHIQLGIESGNNEMLKKIRKGYKIDKALSAAKIINASGIKLTGFFIIGLPEDTEETLNDTLNAMKQFGGHIVCSIFTPFPGTEAFALCKENGLIDAHYDVSLYNQQSPENCFCLNITRDRFREISFEIRKFVDRHNKKQRLKFILYPKLVISIINDYGLIYSFKKYMYFISSYFMR